MSNIICKDHKHDLEYQVSWDQYVCKNCHFHVEPERATSYLEDIEYFERKVREGLKIPPWYMMEDPNQKHNEGNMKPNTGMIRHNEQEGTFQCYDGNSWLTPFFLPKIEVATKDELCIDVCFKPMISLSGIPFTIMVTDTPEVAYDRAMKVV
jgi:hypothetical protein